MRKIILSMQMSLDGYVSGPNGEMDWIHTGTDEWEDIFEEMKTEVDTFLLGAGMYPEYATYWRKVLTDDHAQADDKAFAQLAEKTPHIVFSKSMQSADWENTRIARDMDSKVARLKQEPGKGMMLWGGARLAQSFIEKGLIDEYRLVIVPLMLGSGKTLFPGHMDRRKLELISSTVLSDGAMIVRYRPVQ
jgi:dihydrofolate reductase